MELPVLEMAQVIRRVAPDAIICVDAAHTMFTRPVQIYPATDGDESTATSSLSSVVDYWISNGHKWLAAPKGIAFMWIHPKCMQRGIRPAIVSHGYQPGTNSSSNLTANQFIDESRVLSAFAWDGCRDYGALLTIPSTLHLWKKIAESVRREDGDSSGSAGAGNGRADRDGLHTIRQHNLDTMNTAERLLVKEWNIDKQMFIGHVKMRENLPMRLIPLPWDSTHNGKCTDANAFQLQEKLFSMGIEAPIKCLQGRLYIRLSAHIYNTAEDYQKLARVMKQLYA